MGSRIRLDGLTLDQVIALDGVRFDRLTVEQIDTITNDPDLRVRLACLIIRRELAAIRRSPARQQHTHPRDAARVLGIPTEE